MIGATIAMGAYNVVAFLAVTAAGILTDAQTALNFVMSMNPIGIVIIALGALVAIVALLWNRFDWLRGGVMGIWEVMKGFGIAIKDYVIDRIKELLSGITGIGSALIAFFNGDFKDAFNIGKKAVGDLMGLDSGNKIMQHGLTAAKDFSIGYNKGLEMNTPEVVAAATGEKTKGVDFEGQKPSEIFEPLKGDEDDPKNNKGKDGIVSGGGRMTHINITIGKLQDKTEIHVSSVEKGLDKLGDKVQEILLRSVNSVNQMQTG